ncbi:predicted protein [Chaetoceros tenuissimus]|uniref:Uncharacterized protein n=1 Tax=Chaetoceros tenuissimus TaxID=426638 RepID=A0AAD3D1K7_9STRA|nr:predicted protein [Chaetoceros tenuissimus]
MLVAPSGPSTAVTPIIRNRWPQSSIPMESINISDDAESVTSSVDMDEQESSQEEEHDLALDLPIYVGIFEVLKFQHKNAPPPEPKKEIIIDEHKLTEASITASWRDDETPQAQARTIKEIIVDQDKLTEASIDVSWKDDSPIPQVPKQKKEMIFDDGPIYKNKIIESSIDVSWGIEKTLPKDDSLLHDFDHVFVDEDKQKATKVENEITQTKNSHDSHLIENILKDMELEKKHDDSNKDLLDDAMVTDDSSQNMEHIADEINTEKQNSGILQTFNFLFSGNKEKKNEQLNPEPQSGKDVLKKVEPKKAQNLNQRKTKKSKSKSPAMKWRSKLAEKTTPRRKNSKRNLMKSTKVEEQLIAKKRSRTQNYGGPAYIKLYEMSKHQQSDGKKRRDEIDRKSQESKSMTFTHITRAHTAENRMRENRERRDRMQATLQARFDCSKTAHSLTSVESTELYNRLVKQKKRTEERLKALRRQTL